LALFWVGVNTKRARSLKIVQSNGIFYAEISSLGGGVIRRSRQMSELPDVHKMTEPELIELSTSLRAVYLFGIRIK
jgi:hypothetical protein